MWPRFRFDRRKFLREFATLKEAVLSVEQLYITRNWWKGIKATVEMQTAAMKITRFMKQVKAQFRWSIVRGRMKGFLFTKRRRMASALMNRIGRGYLGRMR